MYTDFIKFGGRGIHFQSDLGGVVHFLGFFVIFGGGSYILFFFLNWGGLEIFPPKLPNLRGGAGKQSKFLGELDENVMTKISFVGGLNH